MQTFYYKSNITWKKIDVQAKVSQWIQKNMHELGNQLIYYKVVQTYLANLFTLSRPAPKKILAEQIVACCLLTLLCAYKVYILYFCNRSTAGVLCQYM